MAQPTGNMGIETNRRKDLPRARASDGRFWTHLEHMSAQHPKRRDRKTWPPLLYIWTAAAGILALVYGVRFVVKSGAAVLAVLLLGILFGLVLVYPIDFLSRLLPRAL